jgi:ABC-2 type transport system permease protein
MQVFKAYFQVIRKHLPSLAVYFLAFAITAAVISSTMSGQTASAFSATRSNIAVFNDDGAALSVGIQDFLSENAQVKEIRDDTESIQDALFFGDVEYVLRIPRGFSESFMNGEELPLQKTTAASQTAAVSIDMLLGQYLRLAGFYRDNLPGIGQDAIVQSVAGDMGTGADVQITDSEKQAVTSNLSYFFGFNAYPLLAILIMGVTTISLVFHETNLSRRNRCSPLSPYRMNWQIFLGNAVFAAAVWLLICGLTLLLYGRSASVPGIAMLCLNALVFTVVSLSIGFLAGRFIKSPVAQSAVANVVSLGISFISGVFVPQELLGATVLRIASFLPGYWYVGAARAIGGLSEFSMQTLVPVFTQMLVQLGFAGAFFLVAMAAAREERAN